MDDLNLNYHDNDPCPVQCLSETGKFINRCLKEALQHQCTFPCLFCNQYADNMKPTNESECHIVAQDVVDSLNDKRSHRIYNVLFSNESGNTLRKDP